METKEEIHKALEHLALAVDALDEAEMQLRYMSLETNENTSLGAFARELHKHARKIHTAASQILDNEKDRGQND